MAIKSILAAIGHFPQDEVVLSRAIDLAARHDAALTLVHVVDLPGSDRAPGGADTLHGQAALAARDQIEAALASREATRPDTHVRIDSGAAALQLIEICENQRPDLIVMRAHQKTGLSERILGSTTDRVIASGTAPVLVIKQGDTRAYSNALVASDGSDDSPGALALVADLLPDAALHLVQAVEIAPQLEEAMLRIGTGQAGLVAHRDALAATAAEELRALAATVPGDISTRILRGDPAEELTRATRAPDVDLVALGPGRSGLIRRAFIGSVSRRLLRDAWCDVLICHPRQTAA